MLLTTPSEETAQCGSAATPQSDSLSMLLAEVTSAKANPVRDNMVGIG
jgi:hypothetical protein